MIFTTPVQIPHSQTPIELGTSILAIGSCFAERVGQQFEKSLFPTVINPTGIYFNPASLKCAIKDNTPDPNLFLHDGWWRSLCYHSQLAGPSQLETLKLIEQAESRRLTGLRTSNILLLTLGTAQVFQVRSTGELVGNCHRLPQQLFHRYTLTVKECCHALCQVLSDWLELDKTRLVILTVSPVRYLRGGLIESSQSKATLLLACAELARNHPRIDYFPAYEIINDELRDYRFYEADLIHPNSQAIQHVWERFQETYFERANKLVLKEIEQLTKLAEHRSSSALASERIQDQGLSKLEDLKVRFPMLDCRKLVQQFMQE